MVASRDLRMHFHGDSLALAREELLPGPGMLLCIQRALLRHTTGSVCHGKVRNKTCTCVFKTNGWRGCLVKQVGRLRLARCHCQQAKHHAFNPHGQASIFLNRNLHVVSFNGPSHGSNDEDSTCAVPNRARSNIGGAS